MNVRSFLLLPALIAAAACNTSPSSEGASGRAEELQCDAALSYGGCVEGSATKRQHGYHVALLRRGDQIRVRLSRLDGDLNPGLALKSPKYSVAVRHASVAVQDASVEKTWMVQSTGFYTFVAFPWSNRGTGSYRIELTCTGGPCMQGPVLDAEVAGACIGEARDCALRAIAGNTDLAAESVPGAFEQCLRAETMPAVCGGACTGEGLEAACRQTVSRTASFAGRGTECAEQVQSCLADCVPFNTTATEVAGLGSHPEMACWTAEGRSNCSGFGMGLASCRDPLGQTGDGYDVGSIPWCEALCLAREGDAAHESCTERCAPQPGADDELPDPVAAEAAE